LAAVRNSIDRKVYDFFALCTKHAYEHMRTHSEYRLTQMYRQTDSDISYAQTFGVQTDTDVQTDRQ
jgi:hypothetical protein